MRALSTYFRLLVILSSVVLADDKPVMRDAAKHEDLVKIKRAELAEGRVAEPAAFIPAEGEDPTVKNAPADLISRSDIISFRGKATLVPKRAILHLPDHLRDRVGNMEGCQLVTWTQFYRENSGWIDIYEVSVDIATGDAGISEESTKLFSDRKNLVVATLMKGPVSVLPLKEPMEDESAEGVTAKAE